MGYFVDRERPVIWRGPMVTKLVVEFLQNVDWGALDYLVLDLPPGTGDVQLTLSQQLAMTGGVIVTTPQEVALADVRRGLKMFSQMNVPVLGLIENMSGFVCGSCGHETEIFGRGGGERMAARARDPLPRGDSAHTAARAAERRRDPHRHQRSRAPREPALPRDRIDPGREHRFAPRLSRDHSCCENRRARSLDWPRSPRRSTFAFSSKPTMSRRESVPNWADFALDTSVRRVPSTSRSVARISSMKTVPSVIRPSDVRKTTSPASFWRAASIDTTVAVPSGAGLPSRTISTSPDRPASLRGPLEPVRPTRRIGELSLVQRVARSIEGDRADLLHRLARDRLTFDRDLGEAAVFVEDPEDPGRGAPSSGGALR